MDRDSELPWLSYRQFSNLVGNLTDMIVEEQNWQPMLDEIWNNRQVADYSGKNINKRDFMRSWDHSRTAEHISLEDVLETAQALTVSCFMILPIHGASLNPRYLPSRAWGSSRAN